MDPTTTSTLTVALSTSTASVIYAPTYTPGSPTYATVHGAIALAPTTASIPVPTTLTSSIVTPSSSSVTTSSAAPASTTSAAISIPKPGSQPLNISHSTVAWLAVISVIVLLTFFAVLWFLCLRPCIKHRSNRPRSRQVLDDRNEFQSWNVSAPVRTSQEAKREWFINGHKQQGSISMVPLTRAAMQPAGSSADVRPLGMNPVTPMTPTLPVIVDEEAPLSPTMRKRQTGFNRASWWSRNSARPSFIGRAI